MTQSQRKTYKTLQPRLLCLIALVLSQLFICFYNLAAEEINTKPRIIIYDVMTASYNPGKSRLLTDVFRSELFKTQLFDIIEKGVVQEVSLASIKKVDAKDADTNVDAQFLALGRAALADKLLICSVEKFDQTIAISVRIVDVKSSFIDYSENIFLTNENLLFDAIKEVAGKIEFFYATGSKTEGLNPEAELLARWTMLGAKDEDLAFLKAGRTDPEEYLTIRQYDITFTPTQYVATLKASLDPGIIRSFLQAGISYSRTERALALGITKLDRYRDTFQRAGFSFEDYLEAYSRNIMTLDDYRDYRKGYQSNYLVLGGGGVADSFPIANAYTKFAIAKVSWERFWSPYQRNNIKYSTDAGLFLLNAIAPTPFIQGNVYAGVYPYYIKIGVGTFAEVILGGHVGLMTQLSFEVMEFLDFSILLVPFGTQPSVAYSDLTSRPGEAGYVPIKFPYAGFTASYKIPFKLR